MLLISFHLDQPLSCHRLWFAAVTYITIYCIYNMINQSATSYLTSSFLENVLNIQFHRGICIFVNSVCLSIVSIYNNVYQDPHASVFPLYRRMSTYTHIYTYVCCMDVSTYSRVHLHPSSLYNFMCASIWTSIYVYAERCRRYDYNIGYSSILISINNIS